MAQLYHSLWTQDIPQLMKTQVGQPGASHRVSTTTAQRCTTTLPTIRPDSTIR